jgi:putative IMPACT (imprinted ancient) family translation regulator
VVVVTRWYGGINLGVGGLVRAYGGCAAECLRRALRRPLIATCDLELVFGFDDTGAVHAALGAHAAEKLAEHFDAEGARLRVRLPLDRVVALKKQLRDATRDRIRLSDTTAHDRSSR